MHFIPIDEAERQSPIKNMNKDTVYFNDVIVDQVNPFKVKTNSFILFQMTVVKSHRQTISSLVSARILTV